MLYATVDRPDTEQYRDFDTSPESPATVRAGKPIPDGTVLSLAADAAQLDSAGNPVKDAIGRFIKNKLVAVNSMQKQRLCSRYLVTGSLGEPGEPETAGTARGFRPLEPSMRAQEIKHRLTMACRLTPSQRETLLASLTSGWARCEALELVQRRFGQTPSCPKYQGAKVVRNGQADGLQRYKCRFCAVTFNALTGTPLARLRHRDKWLLQAHALDQGLSVRKAGARMVAHERRPIAGGTAS